MVYNLTAIYSGGPVDQLNGLTTQSNYILLDGLLIAIFIILLFIMASRQASTKANLFVSATMTAVVSAIISFAMAAMGYPAAVLTEYSTRTLIWFAIAAAALLWNVLSDT